MWGNAKNWAELLGPTVVSQAQNSPASIIINFDDANSIRLLPKALFTSLLVDLFDRAVCLTSQDVAPDHSIEGINALRCP
jgi:hypothetical protein